MSSVARCVTVIAAALVLMYPRHAQSGAGAEPEKDSAVSAPAATVAEAQQHVAMTLLRKPAIAREDVCRTRADMQNNVRLCRRDVSLLILRRLRPS